MIVDEEGRRQAVVWHEVREAELLAVVAGLVGVVRSHTSLSDADLVVRVPGVGAFVGREAHQAGPTPPQPCRVVQLPREAPATALGAIL